MRADRHLLDTLIDISRESAASTSDERTAELRSTATFALGVIGGDRAAARLAKLLEDGHTHTRYNAATGLARWGDARAVPILIEMLDADTAHANPEPTGQATIHDLREVVISNGIRATLQLAAENPKLSVKPLVDALRRLSKRRDVTSRIRMQARRAIVALSVAADDPE
jgi:HEAT repeat protein